MAGQVNSTPLEDLTVISDEIFQRWDMDMKPGKLLLALSGQLPSYDPRITRIRKILEQAGNEEVYLSGRNEAEASQGVG